MTDLQVFIVHNCTGKTALEIGKVFDTDAHTVHHEIVLMRKIGIKIITRITKRQTFYYLETPEEKALSILSNRRAYKRKKIPLAKVEGLGKPSFGFESWAIMTKERYAGYVGYGQRVRGEQDPEKAGEEAYAERRKLGLDRLTGL